jgi:hypothetical protein
MGRYFGLTKRASPSKATANPVEAKLDLLIEELLRRQGPAKLPNEGFSPSSISIEEARTDWPEILERVKKTRRVAWLLLSNAEPIQVNKNSVLLKFRRKGEARGFMGSGYEDDLRGAFRLVYGADFQFLAFGSSKSDGGTGEAQA